jgi:hypothetical protein
MSPRARAVFAIGAVALAVCVWGLSSRSAFAQQPSSVQRDVPANQQGWTDTGVQLKEGEKVTIAATGESSWDGGHSTAGPAGSPIELCQPIVPGLPIGALMARVGTGAPTLAAGATLAGPGAVQVAYNDCADQYFDNTGSFSVTFEVVRPAPPAVTAPAPVTQPATAPQPATSSGGGGVSRLVFLVLLVMLIGGIYFYWRRYSANLLFFDPTARLESSAWLAPMRLRDLQGVRLVKRTLTIGGPDADIDFGIAGVRARLVPTIDGATRIEIAGDQGRVFVNGTPLILGQRLSNGQHVRIGEREFVYFEERDPRAGQLARQSHEETALDKPDPRVATAADPAASS